MQVHVRMFGGMRDFFTERLDLQVGSGAAVLDVTQHLREASPACVALLAACVFVVDNKFVEVEFALCEGAVVEVMPPFSGG